MTTLDDRHVVACGTLIPDEAPQARAVDCHRPAAEVRWPAILASGAHEPAAGFWAALRRMLEGSTGR